jgi:precorrin-3B C17-methyltransferase
LSGRLVILGLGPGDTALRTPQTDVALAEATDLVGYAPYLVRVPPRAGQRRHPSGNGDELDRARHALSLASDGRHVAVVSGGDPGVFGMASAVFAAIEHGEPAWRALDVQVLPGVSALFAAAARLGAPLGHDFCVISLSDNLKPWDVVCARLRAAADTGLVIALYNVASRARPWQLGAALDLLRGILPAATPVVFAHAITRPDEIIDISDLCRADPARADMRTLVLVGSRETRLIARDGQKPWIYAPRSAPAA